MPTISVITPTFNRPELLRRCVESVLSQQVDADIEHLVVNDYGQPLPGAEWMADPRVTVLNTFRTERSVARNTGAALSRGDWLYFLDDDDYTLPGAFAAMLAVAEQTQADHIYGGYTIEMETSGGTQTLMPLIPTHAFVRLLCGETLPPQASWLRRRTFFQTGGFNPHMVPVEDVDLFRRVAQCGVMARTDKIVAQVRVDHPGTTTTRVEEQRRKGDLSLEQSLNWPKTLATVLEQTAADAYWRGRCARVYCGSIVRNLRAGQRLTALNRLAAAIQLAHPKRGETAAFLRGFLKRP